MPLPVLLAATLTSGPVAQTPKVPAVLPIERQLLEDLEEGRTPKLTPAQRARASTRWLLAATTSKLPVNPFPKGSRGHREAEALRALIAAPDSVRLALLDRLPMDLVGTQLALWRWGKALPQEGPEAKPLRVAWEDRLMAAEEAPTLRGNALRHALCHALAEGDEGRLGGLKDRYAAEAGPVLAGFQRLFSLLGGPSPDFRLWTLPELRYADLRLGDLGARRIWVCPASEGLPEPSEATAWIVPAEEASTPDNETRLGAEDAREAKALADRLRSANRKAWFAPSRQAWEALGLAYFPILIELDARGAIQRIRMGDAAPKKP